MRLKWTPEVEKPGGCSYSLWLDGKCIYLLSLGNEGEWGLFDMQGEGAQKLCDWETFDRAKRAAEILGEALSQKQ